MANLQTITVDVSFGEFKVGELVTSGIAVATVRAVNPTSKTISVDQPLIGTFEKTALIMGVESLAVAEILNVDDSHALDLLGLFGDILPDNFSLSEFMSNISIPTLTDDPQNGIQISSTDSLPDITSTTSSFGRDVVSNPSAAFDTSITATRTNPLSTNSKGGLASPDDRHRTTVANEPTDKFEAEYPYNKSYRSEGGHLQEVDDTPGKERLLNQHVSGTYQEMKADGNFVTKVHKDNYTIVCGDDYITVEGRATVHVTGDCQLRVGGFVTVTSDKGINLSTKGDFRVKAKSINMESTTGDVNLKSAKDTMITTAKKTSIKSKSNHIDSEETTSIYAKQELIIAADVDANLVAKNDVYIQAGTHVNVKGTSILAGAKIEAEEIDVATANITTLNAGSTNLKATGNDSRGDSHNLDVAGTTSASVTPPGSAAGPVPANSSKGSGITFISDPDKIMEATDDDPEAAAAAIKAGIENGTINPDEYNKPAPSGGETDSTPPSGNAKIVMKQGTITGVGDSPSDNIRLSTHIQLGMLSKHAIAAPSAVVAQHGLSVEQIVQNLQVLAQNSLELIKGKYPDVVFTSGFRSTAAQKGAAYGAKKVSQHEKGEAADMQFTHADKAQYYEIAKWIKDNVPFDQLLLEYKSTGTGKPWIHISCKGTGNRGMVLTMYNGATKAHGLQNLGI